MRCGTSGERALLEDHYVAPPSFSQVISDTGTGDPAADNDDSGLIVHELVSLKIWIDEMAATTSHPLATARKVMFRRYARND